MITSRLLRPLLTSTLIRPQQVRTMKIESIPMWVGSSNNYAYLVTDTPTSSAVIIDPANPDEVLPQLTSALSSNSINLTAILNTHHHWDHAGGNSKLRAGLPPSLAQVPIIGGKDCEAVTETPGDRKVFKIGKDISVTPLYTPCHTQDSICYYMEDSSTNERAVFTGDTLFIGGCGKFFEGTAHEMHKALNTTLAALPDDTRVFPGHEYTKSNVKFLVTVDQSPAVMKLQAFAENNKETQGKFTIGDEKAHNAFMRVGSEEMKKVTGESEASKVLGKLREMKNSM